MDRIERVYEAINHKEPDKVPKGELGIHEKLIKFLLGRDYRENSFLSNLVKIANLLRMDLVTIWVDPYWYVGDNEKGEKVFEDGWGRVWIDNGFTTRVVKRPLENIRELSKLPSPSVEDCNFELLQRLRKETDLFVVALIGGPYSYGVELLGFENFLLATLTHKKEVKNLMEIITEFYAEVGKRCVEKGAHMVIIGDDLAYNQGTFLSPESLRELVFPYLSQEVEEIKKSKKIPVFLHSDGNLNKVMGDIVSCGFDGLHSLQPSSRMEIGRIKREYGERICLWGNIDLDWLLPFGSQEEVKKVVEETIKVASPGGGYILGTCNILTPNIPVRNIRAMYRTAEKYSR